MCRLGEALLERALQAVTAEQIGAAHTAAGINRGYIPTFIGSHSINMIPGNGHESQYRQCLPADGLSYRGGSSIDPDGISPTRSDPLQYPTREAVHILSQDAADHAYLLRMLDRLSSPLLDPFVHGEIPSIKFIIRFIDDTL